MNAACVVGFLATLLLVYLSFWYASRVPPPRRSRRPSCPPPAYVDAEDDGAEFFTSTASPQDVLDFSEVIITPDQRQAAEVGVTDAAQIQTINDRFRAAKRRVTEDRLEVGVQNTKKRRKVIEQLLRRPNCSRRVRSWRTENGDWMRGDARPKNKSTSTNLVRSAKNNPDIDLHPGALGPVAGLNGLWLSEENLPGNLAPDSYVEG